MYESGYRNIIFVTALVILVGAGDYQLVDQTAASSANVYLTSNLRHKRSPSTESPAESGHDVTLAAPNAEGNPVETIAEGNNVLTENATDTETKDETPIPSLTADGEVSDTSTPKDESTPVTKSESTSTLASESESESEGESESGSESESVSSADDAPGNAETNEPDDPGNLCLVSGTCQEDGHIYYNATYVTDNSLWIELSPEEAGTLSGSAKHLNLSYSKSNYGYSHQIGIPGFLFYGMPIQNITVLTGGFLHVGAIKYLKYLTQVQYIAPFMGHFNPAASNSSNVYYFSNESLYIFQWDNMSIENHTELGNFTFQVQLHANNDIIFAYKQVPTTSIPDDNHATNIGISDAYSLVTTSSVMINVYHKIALNKTKITSGSAVKLVHQPLCTMLTDCYNCTTATLSDFNCHWCEKIGKCSDRGYDSGFNEWTNNGCLSSAKISGQKCDGYCYYPSDPTNTTYTPAPDPDRPIIKASTTVKVDCDKGHAVSVNYKITAQDTYYCSSGGVSIPQCYKSCNYVTKPVNGELKGLNVTMHPKPDAEFPISCNKGHRLRDNSPTTVKCIDNGTLEPDPQNIKCEKFCSLPHISGGHYVPTPTDTGFLHEGDTTTLRCNENYMLRSSGNLSSSLEVECAEGTDLSSLVDECVGFCFVQHQRNTTYSPKVPKVGQTVQIACDNGTVLEDTSTFVCKEPGPILLPGCLVLRAKSTDKGSSHSFLALLLIFIVVTVSVLGGWVFYAYRNPTSPSGLFLIDKCRPWTWRSTAYRRHEESLGESYYMDGGI